MNEVTSTSNMSIDLLTREEAHWSSFRNAVAGFQKDMQQHSKRRMPQSAANGRGVSDGDNKNANPQDVGQNRSHDELDHSEETIDNSKRKQTHQQLELFGVEEVVTKSVNNIGGNELLLPASPSRESHATNALSVAEQQLAETKFKLAMTESERDELEFQLMQNKPYWNGCAERKDFSSATPI